MSRVSLIAVLGLVVIASASLAGCATLPSAWTRADGRPVDAAQLQLDRSVCNGEMQKANLAAGDSAAEFYLSSAEVDVYTGCMAQHGYLATK
jgi:hypothetical protein